MSQNFLFFLLFLAGFSKISPQTFQRCPADFNESMNKLFSNLSHHILLSHKQAQIKFVPVVLTYR